MCNNIFEAQISSAQLTSDLSLMTVHAVDSSETPLCSSSGKTTSGEKLSDVYAGQGGAFSLSLGARRQGEVRGQDICPE